MIATAVNPLYKMHHFKKSSKFHYRLLLNIHELITIKEAMMCGKQGHPYHPFSVWSMVTISISHFLLVLNSATNILVYCLLSSKFREECSKIFKSKPPNRCLWFFQECRFWSFNHNSRNGGINERSSSSANRTDSVTV